MKKNKDKRDDHVIEANELYMQKNRKNRYNKK